MDADTPQRFGDEQAKAILARAIEIDARTPMTTMDDLRAIAAEIGVSPASLQAALQEQTATLEARRVAATRPGAMAAAGVGVPLGLVAGWLLSSGMGSGIGLATLGLSALGLAATGGLIALRGATATLRSFHVTNVALWAGIAAGSLASVMLSGGEVARVPAMMAVAWCVRSWVASAILGSAAVVAVRRSRRPEGPDRDPNVAETSRPVADSRWVRVAKRALAWITRPLRQGAARMPLPLTRRRVASA